MTLRFYKGGPAARAGWYFWKAYDGTCGCVVARGVGARIPVSTYEDGALAENDFNPADGTNLGGGFRTALLPIEE